MTKNSKRLLLFILLVAFAANSCKKEDTQTSLTTFLTRQPWKLALKQRLVYLNSALVQTDTLEKDCTLTQKLTFNTDNTYAYENFVCTANNKISSSWSFTADNLYINLNSVVSVNSNREQNVARIINLGLYSLVLDAGDIYTTTTTHLATDSIIVYRYGFIH